jgi:DNA-binding MarR family transcriptional regulator
MPERTVLLTSAALRLLSRRPTTKVEHTILWYLVMHLPPSGEVLSLRALSAQLHVADSNVNVAMRALCERGFLLRGPKSGRSWHYRLNPAQFRIIS